MSALHSTILLTAVSLFGQVVGFIYRVFLSRMVGSEVMGLYQLVMPVLSVFMSLTAVGFTVACSHLTAQYRALGNYRAARQAVHRCVTEFLIAFAILAFLVAPMSDAISVYLLGDARARLGILLLLPCVLLTGMENIHKHAFYGAGQVTPPALTEVCEQLIRAGAVLGLLWRFLPQSPERAVGLIVCGMVLCEIFSAVTLSLLYRRFSRQREGGEGVDERTLSRKILHIAIPIGWTSLLGNLMGAWTSVLIPQRLVRAGCDVSAAMRAFGVLCGMTLPLLNLPMAFISAMGLVLLPRLSQAAALGRKDLCRRRADKAITAAIWLILPASVLLAVLAPHLGKALFQESTVGDYALPLAIGVTLNCLESVLAVCLNGLGKQTSAARNSLVCGAVQLFLTWWRMALPGVGLQGYVEAFLLSTVLGLFLNYVSVVRAIGLRPQLFRWVVAPGLSAALAGLCVNLLFRILQRSGMRDLPACLACLLFGGTLYLSAMAAQGLLTRPGRHRNTAAQ